MYRAETGPYRIERRLATGGMAEVFVATRLGPRGFEKRIALKRILPQYAADPDFVEMFTDEARLAAQLDHPNIVHVFDFGQDGAMFFIAMELVSGTNVNHLLRAVASRYEQVPLDVVLNIGLEAAAALAYAHSFEDEHGRSLSVVHRDVSPANLLLTRNGQVKLSDFGIARAASFERRTQTGELRGKLGYMSPEQVLAMPLDGTSDVFTLATVMTEMLIVEPLFGREDDLDVLVAIRDGDLSRLHESRRHIPDDVRDLLLTGLARRRQERPNAAEYYRLVRAMLSRRGIPQSDLQTARLLSRLKLVSLRRCDSVALEPGEQASFDDDPPRRLGQSSADSQATNPATAEEQTVPDAQSAGRVYSLRALSGVAQLSFVELTERWLSGQLRADAVVATGGELRPFSELPEFARFHGSPALTWESPAALRPTWQGRIENGRLLPVVYQLVRAHETGVLHLIQRERRKKIYFKEGNVDFVASTDLSELLGRFLVESGRCVQSDVDLALSRMQQCNGRLVDALVNAGVLRSVEVVQILREQVRARFVATFAWDRGDWSYVRGDRSLEETFGVHLSPFELLPVAAARVPRAIVERTLSGIHDRVLHRSQALALLVNSYRLPEGWSGLLQQKSTPLPVAEWLEWAVAEHQISEMDARRAVYFGLSCELLRVG